MTTEEQNELERLRKQNTAMREALGTRGQMRATLAMLIEFKLQL